MTALPSVDVVCLGESMVTFMPSRPGRLADVPAFDRGIGGAESNVACALARTGHRTRWLSRVGADGFGDHLLETVAAAGVDTSAVQRDPVRPTGVYFRTAGERALSARAVPAAGGAAERAGRGAGPAGGTSGGPAAAERAVEPAAGPAPVPAAPAAEDGAGAAAEPVAEVVYYRAGSAAAAMSPVLMPREQAWSGSVLHLSGITAALSDGCLDLMRDLTTRGPGRPVVSFDVNYRAGLWAAAARRDGAGSGGAGSGGASGAGSGDGPAVLAELARGCDIVFVGEDEAEAAWGLRGPDAVRAALPEPEILVVKQGGRGATVFARRRDGSGESVSAAALRVDVVASVGAGDAFAAGFLSATLRGLPLFRRVRHGHLLAAASLTVPGDLGVPPGREYADRLAGLPADDWGRLRLGPGWTTEEAPAVRVEVSTT